MWKVGGLDLNQRRRAGFTVRPHATRAPTEPHPKKTSADEIGRINRTIDVIRDTVRAAAASQWPQSESAGATGT